MRLHELPPRLKRSMLESLDYFRPKPDVRISDWVAENRMMSAEASQRVGPWDREITPFADPIMDSLLDPDVELTVALMAAQTVKTELILNAVAYFMAYEPSPILIGQPTVEPMARAFAKDRLGPMIRDMRCLSRLFGTKEKDATNTTLHKKFLGGHVTIAGYNSSSSLASRPIRVFCGDEIDRQGHVANPEGDPIDQAIERTSAFDDAVILLVTSPGTAGIARSEPEWEASDKNEWYVPCGACGEPQLLQWHQVQWLKDQSGEPQFDSAVYVCISCGEHWDDEERILFARQGAYRPTREFEGKRGFRVSALNSPWSSRSMPRLARRWASCKGDPARLKVFVNTVLCEYWQPKAAIQMEADVLEERKESWGSDVPAEVVLITVGVDVQENRLEYEVVGWTCDRQSYSLEYGTIYGNFKTDASESGEPLHMDERLDRVVDKEWTRADGAVMVARGVAIDAGYASQRVLEYAKPRFVRPCPDGHPRFLFATKGVSDMYGQRPVWPEVPSESKKYDRLPFWPIGVDSAKDQVVAMLGIVEGAGQCHFPKGRSRAWFDQLTAERSDIKRLNGRDRRVWSMRPGQTRNEALDCRVMAFSVYIGLQGEPFQLDMEQESERVAASVGAVQQEPEDTRRFSRGID